jgi:hypothetical protein
MQRLTPTLTSSLNRTTFGRCRAVSQACGARATGYWLLDVSLNKTFTIHEHFKAQLRGEAYNVPNHVNLDQYPGFTPSQPGSSQITYTNGPSPRTIQLAVKLMF